MADNPYLGSMQMAGLTGTDTKSMINKIMEKKLVPVEREQTKFDKLSYQQKAWQAVDKKLSDFWSYLADFRIQSTLIPKKVTSADEKVITVTAQPAAINRSLYVNVVQMASPSKYTAASGPNFIRDDVLLTKKFSELSYTTTPSFASGDPSVNTFTIKTVNSNGNITKNVSIDMAALSTGDPTVQQILDKINTEFSGTMTAELNNGKLQLVKQGDTNKIILGSSSDTSNFFDVFKLNGAADSTGKVVTSVSGEVVGGTYPTPADDTLNNLPLIPGSITFSLNGGLQTLKDDGGGNLKKVDGTVVGFINYTTGKFSVFSDSSLDGKSMDSVSYKYQTSTTLSGLESTEPVWSVGQSKAFSNYVSGVSSIENTITVNGVDITFTSSDSLTTLIAKINGSQSGATASVDSSGRFFVENREGGPADISISGKDSGGKKLLVALKMLEPDEATLAGTISAGEAAIVKVSSSASGTGAMTVTSWTNNVVFEDITINLKSLSETSSTYTKIDVEQDVDKSVEKIKEYVTKYNELMDFLYVRYKKTPASTTIDVSSPTRPKDPDAMTEDMTEEQKLEVVLRGDNNLQNIFMKMRSISYGTVDWYSEDKPKYSSFSQIGIINGDAGKTYENTLKGHLSVDESTLKAKLKENPIDVWNIISEEKEVVVGYDSTNKPIYAKNSGVVTQVKDYIWQVTKYSGTIDQISGTNGTIGKEMNRIAKWLVNAINKLQKKEADLYQTFSKMEQAVSKMSIQGSYLLSKLGNNSSNSNQ